MNLISINPNIEATSTTMIANNQLSDKLKIAFAELNILK